MLNVKQLLAEVTSEEVCEMINFHYEGIQINDFILLIERLKHLEPKQNENDFYLYIKILKEQGDDLFFVDEFDEHDKSVYYDVCGADDAHDCYTIVGTGHAEFLGYYVDEMTIKRLSPVAIIAHLLWEVTFLGFKDSAEEWDGALG